jgi:YfiH family protein
MFTRTPGGVYRSDVFSVLPWIEHGFGSREPDGWPGEYTQVKQIHSDIIARADGDQGCLGEGDALITAVPGQFIGIRTADCVPLLIADRNRRVVAAVHAGWRGSAAGIAGKTVRRLSDEYGTNPIDLLVAIGPTIGQCCFEVGPEVAAQFEPYIPGSALLDHIDLVEANMRQLLSVKVQRDNIDASCLCTACSPGEFHSWRRDRERSGRMVAAIRIMPAAF